MSYPHEHTISPGISGGRAWCHASVQVLKRLGGSSKEEGLATILATSGFNSYFDRSILQPLTFGADSDRNSVLNTFINSFIQSGDASQWPCRRTKNVQRAQDQR
jgi:hypothetical protein